MRARAICRPTSDVAFSHTVRRCLASLTITSARQLETELRPLFPTIQARRDGQRSTWYVNRDRGLTKRPRDSWWARSDTPALVLSATNGTIVGFNDQAADLFGRAADDLIGLPYAKLVHPSVVDAAAGIWALLLEIGSIETAGAVMRPDGSQAIVELRARLDEDVVEARYRKVGLIRAPEGDSAAPGS